MCEVRNILGRTLLQFYGTFLFACSAASDKKSTKKSILVPQDHKFYFKESLLQRRTLFLLRVIGILYLDMPVGLLSRRVAANGTRVCNLSYLKTRGNRFFIIPFH